MFLIGDLRICEVCIITDERVVYTLQIIVDFLMDDALRTVNMFTQKNAFWFNIHPEID